MSDLIEPLTKSLELVKLSDWRERLLLERETREKRLVTELTDGELAQRFGSSAVGLCSEAVDHGNGWADLLRIAEVRLPEDSELRFEMEQAREDVDRLMTRLKRAVRKEQGK